MLTFEKCTSLNIVILPDKSEEICQEAFLDCTSLENIDIFEYIYDTSFLIKNVLITAYAKI